MNLESLPARARARAQAKGEARGAALGALFRESLAHYDKIAQYERTHRAQHLTTALT